MASWQTRSVVDNTLRTCGITQYRGLPTLPWRGFCAVGEDVLLLCHTFLVWWFCQRKMGHCPDTFTTCLKPCGSVRLT